jgi:hypothetical protein
MKKFLPLFVVLALGCGRKPEKECPPASAGPATPSTAVAPANAPPTDAPPPLVPAAKLESDEGMWTFDNFPSAKLQERHGFAPSKEWLDKVRLSSVRLAQGCSGSLVSPQGLVMTNHHCVHRCVQELSTPQADYIADGFYAKEAKDERRCPGLEINRLVEITDVTAAMEKAAAGLDDARALEARRAEKSRIEKACATGPDGAALEDTRCDVVTLYQGGRYHLYRYERHRDVRLVFVPELAIAFFGGDPDNFMFPRFDLDLAFLRVYKDDQPAALTPHFGWSDKGARDGELTFVSGHPGSTSRQVTVAMLEFERDVELPFLLNNLFELRGMLKEFQTRGDEARRVSTHLLFGVENGLKARRGMHGALLDRDLFGRKLADERALRAAVERDPKLKATAGGAWAAIEKAQTAHRAVFKAYALLERGWYPSPLMRHARALVRAAAELPLADDARLPEFTDSQFPPQRQALLSPAPVYPELERAVLGLLLTRIRDELGPDHPVVRRVFAGRDPAVIAAEAVAGTQLGDPKVREALLTGQKAAVDASKDPLVRLAAALDADARAARKAYEDQVEAVERRQLEAIARARFALLGDSVYPDATFSLRLSFGKVQGWDELGVPVPPFTTIDGAFSRHTGSPPFDLPKRWLDAKGQLDLATPFNFCATNDIIGGNSGSPVFNQAAEIVGLVFDGNIHSLGGDYAYVPANNRMVAVHSRAIVEALRKIYGADRLLKELGR